MYYVCNDPNPRNVSTFQAVALLGSAGEARMRAVVRAEEQPGTSWYVHEFAQSVVTFKASSVVSVETEMIDADPFSE